MRPDMKSAVNFLTAPPSSPACPKSATSEWMLRTPGVPQRTPRAWQEGVPRSATLRPVSGSSTHDCDFDHSHIHPRNYARDHPIERKPTIQFGRSSEYHGLSLPIHGRRVVSQSIRYVNYRLRVSPLVTWIYCGTFPLWKDAGE